MGHFAAIILAAGFSTRMGEVFKPLLPLHFPFPKAQSYSALAALVELYKTCGVQDILVVTGQRENEALACEVKKLQERMSPKVRVHRVPNAHAARGMFSSVVEGVQGLMRVCPQSTHFFVHPVDIPLVRMCTLQNLMQAAQRLAQTLEQAVLMPTYEGQEGHPPLIPICFANTIVASSAEDGLRGVLQSLPVQTIPTADSHILLDMDTLDAYAALQKKALCQHELTPEEALALLHCLQVSPQGLLHAQSVACVTEALAKAYAAINPHIRSDLAKTGALLHDMCKLEPQHEKAAGRLLRRMGFAALAPLVEEHNDCQLDEHAPVTEKELIYLADKYIRGHSLVPLEERFTQKLQLYAHIPEACMAIRARLGRAQMLQGRVSAELGIDVFTLAKQALHAAGYNVSAHEIHN